MPTPTMQHLHAHRLACLLLVIAVFAAALWLLGADVARYYIKTTAFNRTPYQQLVAPDSGISGMMGVTAFQPHAHAAVAAVGLTLFTLTMILFLRPRRGWMDRALQKGKPPTIPVAAAAVVAGLVTVGYLATLFELIGRWSQLPSQGHPYIFKFSGIVFQPAAYFAFNAWAVAAVAWFLLLRRPAKNHDWFIRMIIITYGLFVAAGLLTLIACALQIYHLRLINNYTESGAYTGAGIGFTVMLWTAVPSLVLIYTGERYRRITNHLCLACGYNLEGTPGSSCPECGAPTTPCPTPNPSKPAHAPSASCSSASSRS